MNGGEANLSRVYNMCAHLSTIHSKKVESNLHLNINYEKNRVGGRGLRNIIVRQLFFHFTKDLREKIIVS